ncbi:MAG: hypothetical protein IPP72_04285 [Chitinophagaceae bacterium]|nr:hypothetical protein [Chitinophagaceae bacterium]
MDSFTMLNSKCQVNPSGAVLKAVPFVQNEDILSYSESAYTYTLSSAAMQRIKALVGRQPFAITVDGEVVFGFIIRLF